MVGYKELLETYKTPFSLIRLGRNCDGGYVIPEESINDNLLTCGIADEISFEEDYIKRVAHPNIHCFDGTIENFPSRNPLYSFHCKNIGPYDDEYNISLNTIFSCFFKEQSEVFLKMDIEGGEYTSFMTLSQENLKKINCMVLEVHDIDFRYNEFSSLMYKLNSELVLIHRHVNDYGGYFSFNNEEFGRVYELTFINKNYILKKNDNNLPIEGIDFPNFVN